jgi:hypothetical protein
MSNYKYKGVDLYDLCGGSSLSHSYYKVNGSSISLRTTNEQYDRITQGVNDVYKQFTGTAAFDPTGAQGLGAVEVNAIGLNGQQVPSWADAFKVHIKSKKGNTGENNRYHSGQGKAPYTSGWNTGGAGGAGKDVYVEDMYYLPTGQNNYIFGAVDSDSSTLTIKSPNGAVEYQVKANNGNNGGGGNSGYNKNWGNDGTPGSAGNVETIVNVNQVNGSSLPSIKQNDTSDQVGISSIYFFKL